jgi:hypothetical protein
MISAVNIAPEGRTHLVKNKLFRTWVGDLYFQNCEEYLTYNQTGYTLSEYWNKYKWWLRREFRHQQRKNND